MAEYWVRHHNNIYESRNPPEEAIKEARHLFYQAVMGCLHEQKHDMLSFLFKHYTFNQATLDHFLFDRLDTGDLCTARQLLALPNASYDMTSFLSVYWLKKVNEQTPHTEVIDLLHQTLRDRKQVFTLKSLLRYAGSYGVALPLEVCEKVYEEQCLYIYRNGQDAMHAIKSDIKTCLSLIAGLDKLHQWHEVIEFLINQPEITSHGKNPWHGYYYMLGEILEHDPKADKAQSIMQHVFSHDEKFRQNIRYIEKKYPLVNKIHRVLKENAYLENTLGTKETPVKRHKI